jgi:hypothetical protein
VNAVAHHQKMNAAYVVAVAYQMESVIVMETLKIVLVNAVAQQ